MARLTLVGLLGGSQNATKNPQKITGGQIGERNINPAMLVSAQ